MSEDRRFLGLPIWKWDGIAGATALVGLLAVLITAVVGLYQLNARSEAARAEATLKLLDAWEERGFLADFRTLDGKVRVKLAQVPDSDIAAAREDPVIQARLYERVSGEVLQEPEAMNQFETIVYFFQRVDICVQAGLCAKDPTAQFFEKPMQDFARVFAAEITARRANDTNFAKWLSETR